MSTPEFAVIVAPHGWQAKVAAGTPGAIDVYRDGDGRLVTIPED